MPFNFSDLADTGWFFVKLGAILGMSLYVIFSFIVMKQVGIMTQTLEVNFEKPLRLIALAHLVLAILVFIYSVIM